jgi:hypothetical protein
MSIFLLLFLCSITWALWAYVVILENTVKSVGTSVMPSIPVFPLLFWGIGLGLNALKNNLGFFIVGGLHIVLLVVFSLLIIQLKTNQNKIEKEL